MPDDWTFSATGRADAHITASMPAPFANCLGETIPRGYGAFLDTQCLTPGRLNLTRITLQQGVSVGQICFALGATVMVNPTAWWFCLYPITANGLGLGNLARQTANQGSAIPAANALPSLALSSAYIPPYTGAYYVGANFTCDIPPSLCCAPVPVGMNQLHPTRHLDANTGLTLTAPTTISNATNRADVPYAYCAQ